MQGLFIRPFCQSSIEIIDRTLSNGYKKIRETYDESRYDSVAPQFKKQLTKFLLSPITLNHRLDSLETLITIIQSPDKKIKFYSWDELTGGTWHAINVFAQYSLSGNKVSYQQLDTDKEVQHGGFTDSEIFEVNEIQEAGKVHYLTFGWGTHGSGKQHMIVQVFKIDGGKLITCRSFLAGKKELVIEYPRNEKAELKFDKLLNTISFNEFETDPEGVYTSKTGKRKVLRFVNGIFK